MLIRSRIPNAASIAGVYSVIVIMLYGWSLTAYIWKLPSWLNYLSTGEVLVILAYTMASALFESIVFISVLIGISTILPRRLLSDDFIVRGAVIIICVIASVMTFLSQYVRAGQAIANSWLVWLAMTLAILALLLFVVSRWLLLRHVILFLTDRAIVFLYILMPLSIISTLVVLYRNLF